MMKEYLFVHVVCAIVSFVAGTIYSGLRRKNGLRGGVVQSILLGALIGVMLVTTDATLARWGNVLSWRVAIGATSALLSWTIVYYCSLLLRRRVASK